MTKPSAPAAPQPGETVDPNHICGVLSGRCRDCLHTRVRALEAEVERYRREEQEHMRQLWKEYDRDRAR